VSRDFATLCTHIARESVTLNTSEASSSSELISVQHLSLLWYLNQATVDKLDVTREGSSQIQFSATETSGR